MSECYMLPTGQPGPDYVCAKCGDPEAWGMAGMHEYVRLWREAHHAGDLLCADHAADKERAAGRDPEPEKFSDTIGYMLPARPHPDGDTFYGHSSGTVEWWYTLPKYRDPERELEHLRAERNRFVEEMLIHARSRHEVVVEVLELRHKLSVEQQSKVPANAERWRAALVKIRDVQLDDVGSNTESYTTETSLKMRLVAEAALR